MKAGIVCLLASLSVVSGFTAPSSGLVSCGRACTGLRRGPVLELLGGDDDRKPLTREDEPDEYFQSNFESLSTEDKFKDPLVIIGLASIFLPFILLIVFNSMGLIGI